MEVNFNWGVVLVTCRYSKAIYKFFAPSAALEHNMPLSIGLEVSTPQYEYLGATDFHISSERGMCQERRDNTLHGNQCFARCYQLL
jgi:hypothetical protein